MSSQGAVESTFTERFWDTVCGYQQAWYALFVLAIVLFVLLLLALPALEPGSEGYVVATIDLIVLVVTMAGTGFVTLRCRK